MDEAYGKGWAELQDGSTIEAEIRSHRDGGSFIKRWYSSTAC
ncbi:hypothetical protein [Mesorhizobium muleiense]|nr:hypothetical protein [Mesorhizobium muleiense]